MFFFVCFWHVPQGSHEHFLVLFSFHLLILSLDHSKQDFIYEVILCTLFLKWHSDKYKPTDIHQLQFMLHYQYLKL